MIVRGVRLLLVMAVGAVLGIAAVQVLGVGHQGTRLTTSSLTNGSNPFGGIERPSPGQFTPGPVPTLAVPTASDLGGAGGTGVQTPACNAAGWCPPGSGGDHSMPAPNTHPALPTFQP
jgi:hypothetical protein